MPINTNYTFPSTFQSNNKAHVNNTISISLADFERERDVVLGMD